MPVPTLDLTHVTCGMSPRPFRAQSRISRRLSLYGTGTFLIPDVLSTRSSPITPEGIWEITFSQHSGEPVVFNQPAGQLSPLHNSAPT